jgi:hypothetical protein
VQTTEGRRMLVLMAATCSVMIACIGCSASRVSSRVRPWPEFGRDGHGCTSRGDGAIQCDGREVARVLCSPRTARTCRALGIRYADDGEMIWLYKASGYDPSRPESYKPPSYVDIDFAIKVNLAVTGRYIWFATRSLQGRERWHLYYPVPVR